MWYIFHVLQTRLIILRVKNGVAEHTQPGFITAQICLVTTSITSSLDLVLVIIEIPHIAAVQYTGDILGQHDLTTPSQPLLHFSLFHPLCSTCPCQLYSEFPISLDVVVAHHHLPEFLLHPATVNI